MIRIKLPAEKGFFLMLWYPRPTIGHIQPTAQQILDQEDNAHFHWTLRLPMHGTSSPDPQIISCLDTYMQRNFKLFSFELIQKC